MIRKGIFVPACLALAAVTASADKIHQTDGKVLADIRIVSETVKEVTYKKGNNNRTVPSEKVLRIEFDRFPEEVDEAQGSILSGDLGDALDLLDTYVDAQIAKPNERRFKWAPAYAAWRAVELRMELADLTGATAAATRLIKNFPDSRYVPGAYLAKANALFRSENAAQAERTLGDFEALIASKSLSKRWELECRLAKIQVDSSMKGDSKRNELALVASAAGSEYPTVKSRAEVISGETYLDEAEKDKGKADELRAEARKVFERIVKDANADDETLAGAFTGLGESLFYSAGQDLKVIDEARMHFLRVVVLYEAQSRYVPKALFYAMLCSDRLEDSRIKKDMKRALKQNYPNSRWATEADKY